MRLSVKGRATKLTAHLPPLVARLEQRRIERLARELEAIDDASLLEHGLDLCEGTTPEERETFDRFARATLALQAAASSAASRAPVPPETARQIAGLAMRLAQQAPHPQQRATALRCLKQALATLPREDRRVAVGEDAAGACTRICGEPGWPAVEACALLLELWPERGVRAANTLLTIDSPSDSFVTRAAIVRMLGRVDEGVAVLLEKARRGDSSEMVRQALASALADLAGERPDLLDAALEPLDPEAEPNARVRATAARALLRSAPFERLRRALSDPTPVVRRAFMEALRTTALEGIRLGTPAPTSAEAMILALDTLRCQKDTGADEARGASDAIEALCAWSSAVGEMAREVQKSVQGLAEGQTCTLEVGEVTADTLGRALALLSQDGLGLYARLERGRARIRRGERERTRLWRILFELTHLRPNKRPDIRHTVGAWTPEPIRAHASRLAATAPTSRVGEPVVIAEEAGWGRHLPSPDDVLSLGMLSRGMATSYSSRGMTTLRLPDTLLDRARIRWRLTREVERAWQRRELSLRADPGAVRQAWVQWLQQIGVEVAFQPYALREDSLLRDPWAESLFLQKGSRAAFLLAPASADLETGGPLSDLVGYALTPVGNDIGQLALYAAGLASIVLAAAAFNQWSAERHRSQIPLTVGGWGTRGKSSLERLKAAMFAGLGYEVLCKTTGSTPSLLHATPWHDPVELPLYRPGGRATIWEQRDVLAVAATLGVQVLTWECMAIRPSYAQILQSHWMRDTHATLTNAHPDHEDHQGPGGRDVARSLAAIAGPGSTLITAEHAMLPIIKAESAARGARVQTVDEYDHELIAGDLMALFPYLAHRRNVALLRQLAEALGIDPDMATVEAARNVVPDVGALTHSRRIAIGAHEVTFVNAMAANDPVSALESLNRIPAYQHLVVVTNTRRDRSTRTEAFARLLATHIDAAGRVITGNDIHAARRTFLAEARSWVHSLPINDVYSARARLALVLARIGITDQSGSAITATLRTTVERSLEERGWQPPGGWETVHELAKEALTAEVDPRLASVAGSCRDLPATRRLRELVQELPPFAVCAAERAWLHALAPRAAVTCLLRAVDNHGVNDAWRAAFDALAVDLLESTLAVAPPDADAVLVSALRLVPPSDMVLVAMQNIKGVGQALLSSFASAERILQSPALEVSHPAWQKGLLPAAAVCQALKSPTLETAEVRRRAAARVDKLLAKKRTWPSRLVAGLVWQLRALSSAALTPLRSLAARRTLLRFAHGRITGEEARQRLEELSAREM